MQDFLREPSEDEWAQLSVYARRMRYFTGFWHAEPSEAALVLLNKRFSGRCMMPRLRDIGWLGAPPGHLELMLPLIVSPALTNFRLGLFAQDILNASQVVPVLEALALACNSLVEVHIGHPTVHDLHTIRAASDLLLKCNPEKLRTFRVISSLSTEAFIYATRLPNLEKFVIVADTTEPGVQLPTSTFPSLRSLEILATDTRSSLLQTISHIESNTFEVLELEFPAATSETFLSSTLANLRPRGLHQMLTMLFVTPEGDFDLDKTTIRPFLFLNQLTQLDITLVCTQDRCSYKLTDEDLEELVAAMPKLEILSFGSFPCARSVNNTVKSLTSIAKHCKHLEQLAIHINVEAIVTRALQGDEVKEDPALEDCLSIFAGCPLRTIVFGACFIPNDEQGAMIFALTLSRLFPHLRSVTVFPPDGERDSLWDLVDVVIAFSRKIRINVADAGKFTSFLPYAKFAHSAPLQLLARESINLMPTYFFPRFAYFRCTLYVLGSLEPVCKITNARVAQDGEVYVFYCRSGMVTS